MLAPSLPVYEMVVSCTGPCPNHSIVKFHEVCLTIANCARFLRQNWSHTDCFDFAHPYSVVSYRPPGTTCSHCPLCHQFLYFFLSSVIGTQKTVLAASSSWGSTGYLLGLVLLSWLPSLVSGIWGLSSTDPKFRQLVSVGHVVGFHYQW